jgi:hypothetical protein
MIPAGEHLRRFNSRINKGINCWEWTGYLSWNGYGQFKFAGRRAYAHRVSYELEYGEIPARLQIDHLCRNRKCVKPSHLRAVTQRENLLAEGSLAIARMNSLKTTCPRHACALVKMSKGRECKECQRERQRKWALNHLEQKRAASRLHYAAHKAEKLAYRQAHRERQRAYNKRYFISHREQMADYKRNKRREAHE